MEGNLRERRDKFLFLNFLNLVACFTRRSVAKCWNFDTQSLYLLITRLIISSYVRAESCSLQPFVALDWSKVLLEACKLIQLSSNKDAGLPRFYSCI